MLIFLCYNHLLANIPTSRITCAENLVSIFFFFFFREKAADPMLLDICALKNAFSPKAGGGASFKWDEVTSSVSLLIRYIRNNLQLTLVARQGLGGSVALGANDPQHPIDFQLPANA